MNSLFVSWKTSIAGVAAILTGVGALLTAFTTEPLDMTALTAALSGVSAGVGLLASRDADKSSQEQGVRR